MRKKHEIFFLVDSLADFLVDSLADFLVDFLGDKVVFFQVCLRVCFRVYFLAARSFWSVLEIFSRGRFFIAPKVVFPLSPA